jgi:hypothetical protein
VPIEAFHCHIRSGEDATPTARHAACVSCASLLAALRLRSAQPSLGPAAIARNASSAPGCGSGVRHVAASASFDGMSRSARARTRVLELFITPIPSRGYGVHLNITHGALCATR